MTSATLTLGSALLAFGPSLSMLFLICYRKAQLIIVVTTSAFFFLLSVLGASALWWTFEWTGLASESFAVILVPGVICQFLLRCGFVRVYHKVESVIERSIERHQEQQLQGGAANANGHGNPNSGGGAAGAGNDGAEPLTDTARLRLELNDWACGIAAGTGFGGMHAILLYGTLLASEASNLGTLYQPACPGAPSLVVSALNAFFFSILDLLWMLFTFFGMRRRYLPGRHDRESFAAAAAAGNVSAPMGLGSFFGNGRPGGNLSLVLVFFTHCAAAFATIPNAWNHGCVYSLPAVGVVTIVTSLAFHAGVSKIYLPPHQKRRLSGDEHRD